MTLKTYDPVSGTVLKYRTDKAAEVGRLIAGLGKCGKVMAATTLSDDSRQGGIDHVIRDEGASHVATVNEKKIILEQQGKEGGAGPGKKKKGKK